MIFVDTCVLIELSKGKIKIDNYENLFINSIVELEFLYGALNKQELNKIKKILNNFNLLEINQYILDYAVKLLNQYGLSHNMTIYDAIIASTCIIYDIKLWTYNKKDFRYLDIELI